MTYEYQEEDYYDVDKNINVRYKTANFEFVCTCYACPEQYDVFLEGKQVGYVRLRWAGLRCYYPDVGDDSVYVYIYQWYGEEGLYGDKGEFADDNERKYHLELIAQALYNKIFNAEHTAES